MLSLKNRSLVQGSYTACLALLMGSTAATLPAYAQEETTLLERLVISAAGGAVSLYDAPASVTVLSSEEIEKMPAETLQQVLAQAQGVSINHSGNNEKVQIRGLGERYTLFLIDGKRVSSAPNLFRGNDFDSGWMPVSSIERIEIVRGPMSSLYGSDAIGGVINIITKRAADKLTGSIVTEYTFQENDKSGNYWRTGAHLAGPIIEDVLSFSLAASWDHREADASDINAPHTIWNGDPIPGFLMSDNKYLSAGLDFTPDDQNKIDLDYDYSYRTRDGVPMDRQALSLSHSGDYDFGTTELKIWGDRVHNFYGHGNVTKVDQPNTAYNANIDGKVVLPLDVALAQTLTIGGSYNYQRIDDAFVLTGAQTSEVFQVAAFVEDEFRITDDLFLTLGNRVDYHEDFGLHNSPRAYVVYHPVDNFTIRGGVSSAFKAPTLLESSPNWYQISCGGGCNLIGSSDLKPETSVSGEFGVAYDDGTWGTGVTLFYNQLTDMIPFPPARTADPIEAATFSNFVGVDSNGNLLFSYENIDSAVTKGIEAFVTYNPNDQWSLAFNYTYTDSKATSGVERPLAFKPPHVFNATLGWHPTDDLSFSLAVNHYSSQYTWVPTSGDLTRASMAEAYTTVDLGASYTVNNNLTLTAAIHNVLDAQVFRENSDNFNVDGRRFTLSARAQF